MELDRATSVTATSRPVDPPVPHGRRRDLAALARARWQDALRLGVGADAIPIAIDVPLELGGVVITARDSESRGEPVSTTLTSPAGRVVSVLGEPIAVAGDGELVVVNTDRGVYVVELARGTVLAAFATGNAEVSLAVRGDVAAIATVAQYRKLGDPGVLHVVRGNGAWARLPMPGSPGAISLSEGRLEVHVRGRAVRDATTFETNLGLQIETAQLVGPASDGVPRDLALALGPASDARPDDAVCIVRSVIQRFVSLTELKTDRRFNVRVNDAHTAARFAKGERVYIVDNDLVKEAELPAGFGAPETTVYAAAALPPIRPPEVAPDPRAPRSRPPELAELERTLGFVVSPLLARYLALEVRWPMGIPAPSLEPADVGVPIDPSFVTLFDSEDGDYIGIYHYPPARAEGHAVVAYVHDEGVLRWLGHTFEDALASHLRDELAHDTTPLSILRLLHLPITFLDDHPPTQPPAWFTAAHPLSPLGDGAGEADDDDPAATATRLRSAGDLVGAERAWIRALHQSAWQDPSQTAGIVRALGELYRELEWPIHAVRI